MNPEQIGKNIAKRILIEEFTEKVVLYPGAFKPCLLYTSPSPRDRQKSRMPSSA